MEQIRQFERRGLINKDPVCRGTAGGMSASARYVAQYRSFKNCRVVVGNLELTYLNCPNLDYSFYQNITEITGRSNYIVIMLISEPTLCSTRFVRIPARESNSSPEHYFYSATKFASDSRPASLSRQGYHKTQLLGKAGRRLHLLYVARPQQTCRFAT